MKSYFSKTSCSSNNKIILQEGENIVSDNQGVTEVFNEFFVNVARDIGLLRQYLFKFFRGNWQDTHWSVITLR
jgi:hypothetical protein